MVSLDDADENESFAESIGAELVLLSDESRETAKRYGVTSLGGAYARRWTYYIDSEGVIRYIDKDVDTGTHGEDILRKLRELGMGRSSPD